MDAPDFNKLSQAFSTFSVEYPKFANVPAFNQEADILNALARINDRLDGIQMRMDQGFAQMNQRFDQMDGRFDQMDGRFDQMERRFDQMDQRSDTLETRMNAINQNSVSRTQNSMVSFADRRLTPLINASTSENIPEFPETPAALKSMSSADIDRVLLALGASNEGTLEARRDSLRVAIGMIVSGF